MVKVAVSTWALHRTVGQSIWSSPADPTPAVKSHGPAPTSLPDLIPLIKEHGFDRVEICHFHFMSRDAEYLAAIKAAAEESGVRLQTLLIDEGDLSHPESGDRDRDWIAGWIETAKTLGAESVRVIAGKSAWSDRTAAIAAGRLKSLVQLGLPVRIENWFELTKTPANVLDILDRVGPELGLCLDFGNWGGSKKYANLAAIAPRAETCHAKADFCGPDALDADDFATCLELVKDAGFDGPYVLVNGREGDREWNALDIQRDFILKTLGE